MLFIVHGFCGGCQKNVWARVDASGSILDKRRKKRTENLYIYMNLRIEDHRVIEVPDLPVPPCSALAAIYPRQIRRFLPASTPKDM